jgi:hypothetical protein
LCRLELQRIVSGSLDSSILVTQDIDFETDAEVVAALNIGDPLHLYRHKASNGSVEYLLEGLDVLAGVPNSGVDETDSAAQVPVVMVLHNFPRSFLQILGEITPIVVTPADVDSTNHTAAQERVERSRRKILQQVTGITTSGPEFGVIEVAVNAMARCGNAICEFGEAVGTWGYPEIWNCPQDCPRELHACPSQVRIFRLLSWGPMVGGFSVWGQHVLWMCSHEDIA